MAPSRQSVKKLCTLYTSLPRNFLQGGLFSLRPFEVCPAFVVSTLTQSVFFLGFFFFFSSGSQVAFLPPCSNSLQPSSFTCTSSDRSDKAETAPRSWPSQKRDSRTIIFPRLQNSKRKNLRRVCDKIPSTIFLVAVAELAERFTYQCITAPTRMLSLDISLTKAVTVSGRHF